MGKVLDPQLESSIARHAQAYGLPAVLVHALVEVESGGYVWAWNPEPRYRYLWDGAKGQPFRPLIAAEIASEFPPPDFPTPYGDADQEWWAQQASWGPMQVMGAVARECGFRARSLVELCTAGEGVRIGCKHLADLRFRFLKGRYGWEGVVAAYNAGSPRRVEGDTRWENQSYVDAVRAALGGRFP